ncbi:hypothetical protein KUCAC02_030170 [Chaenocephalus aceratus]|uniref:Uncharacterized protein n=1 Tax=Chaenocephalus aceratus TaxID=36190 RepID=A0ACB9XJ93_CHAAC|nr:hypothetical protein KUCAC02_030170 [Chaenocephalus aceratus]
MYQHEVPGDDGQPAAAAEQRFSAFNQEHESHKDCQRQDLKSFLALPFQRITRIKLLLQSILKQTKPDADSIANLEKAIAAIHEIVTECDKRVRKMEQIEELVYLDRLLDFGKMKSVPLVVSGRVLLHQGPHETKWLLKCIPPPL